MSVNAFIKGSDRSTDRKAERVNAKALSERTGAFYFIPNGGNTMKRRRFKQLTRADRLNIEKYLRQGMTKQGRRRRPGRQPSNGIL